MCRGAARSMGEQAREKISRKTAQKSENQGQFRKT
jgi:hypothetical protein